MSYGAHFKYNSTPAGFGRKYYFHTYLPEYFNIRGFLIISYNYSLNFAKHSYVFKCVNHASLFKSYITLALLHNSIFARVK